MSHMLDMCFIDVNFVEGDNRAAARKKTCAGKGSPPCLQEAGIESNP